MARIHIGNEYCKTFDSIVRLYEEGCVEEGVITRIDGDRIVTPSHEFVLSRGRASKAGAEKAALINENGATWFGAFRGEKLKNDTAEWLMFVETIKEHFHRNYSVLEYRPKIKKLSKEYVDSQIKLIDNVLKCFYEGFAFEIKRADERDGLEDVYGASFRMEITDGTGEAVPVLGKIYFRKKGASFIPFGKDEAELIDAHITNSFDGEEESENFLQNSVELTDTVVNELDKLVNSKDNDISSNLVFTDLTDKSAVELMVEKGPNENVELTCLSLSLLNIFHFKWRSDIYDILLEDRVALKANVGLGGRLTITCNSCSEKTALIESGKITLNIKGVQKSVTIDATREDLNLTNAAIGLAKEHLFSKHLKRISCSENARLAGICTKYVCDNDTVMIDSQKGAVCKCKNCPHPEVIFKCDDGAVRYTSDLVFVRDAMTLMPKEQTVKCDCCERTFTKDSEKKEYICDFCKVAELGLDSLDDTEFTRGKNLYRKYRGMLPLITRIKGVKLKKYCQEDEDCIMFVIDKDVYIFNKDCPSDSGFLKSPVLKSGGDL
ncbi:MAG: hypothetical protein K2I23_01870 [Clostridia bacterium]|nr:hypothetical protein [Clostridia bacterium]